MNSCTGGCLSGNCMNSGCGNFLEMKEKLVEYIDKLPVLESEVVENESKISMTKIFKDKSKKYEMPDEIALKEVLNKIGKFTKDKELDCGACGYATCREKAIAVINDKADLKMCLPYLRERAESISNVIIHSTPNAIFALTENFIVQEANLAACKIFNLENESLQGKNIFDILDCLDIYLVNETENDILNKKYNYKEHGLIVEQSILYIKESRMIIVIMKDITDDEKKNQQLHKVRCETAAITQKVIDKQMRVVQEIASLLGETTAETKVALTKLKKSILSEISDSI